MEAESGQSDRFIHRQIQFSTPFPHLSTGPGFPLFASQNPGKDVVSLGEG